MINLKKILDFFFPLRESNLPTCYKCERHFYEPELIYIRCGLASGRFCAECIREMNNARGQCSNQKRQEAI